MVTSRDNAAGAHVSVGYVVPESDALATSAVIHLIHYGTGTDVPWEAVGTDDADFGLTTPAYGSTVGSPARVGGTISGVDENIKVVVEQLHSNGYLGESCCTPSGGTNSPWSATVTFAAPDGPGVHHQRIDRGARPDCRTLHDHRGANGLSRPTRAAKFMPRSLALDNEGSVSGTPTVIESIENYSFADDGSKARRSGSSQWRRVDTAVVQITGREP